ncbi:MAG: methionine adenosyltransferase [Nitrospirae bacterium]|nr:methionine adenosyltransferase [Nitrospirota bacterium]
MTDILVERLGGLSVAERRVEIVERKGLGHPDSICDAIMEGVTLALSREYMKRFGVILHHNIDKGLLVAGEVERRFGGGRVVEPMRLIFGDRATFKMDDRTIPINDIAVDTAKQWFSDNLRFVDPESHVRYQVEIKHASLELQDIFKRGGGVFGANDTSAAVGYAPLTETERLVLESEIYLNSKDFKDRFPETGEDIKIMGFRRDRDLTLTIAMPFIDRYITDEDTYFEKKGLTHEAIEDLVKTKANSLEKVQVSLNTLDREGRGLGGMYLSVLGTSAEDADSGEVGRGNRVNGIIALNRPSAAEAAAGKNAVSHVGKIYNILTHKMAHTIYENVDGIKEVYVWLASQIGVPVNEPVIASAQVLLEHRASFSSISGKIKEIINKELSEIELFCNELLQGKYPVC